MDVVTWAYELCAATVMQSRLTKPSENKHLMTCSKSGRLGPAAQMTLWRILSITGIRSFVWHLSALPTRFR